MSDPAYTCHFLDRAAFREAEDRRTALAKARGEDKEWLKANNSRKWGWARFDEVVAPCAMWYNYWFFDPEEPSNGGLGLRREAALEAIRNGSFGKGEHNFYLSRMYWEQWSDKRPPISVLTPNGREWCVDAAASNGLGWTVTGTPPKITCTPSIQVPGYHGFLRDGVFTPNM